MDTYAKKQNNLTSQILDNGTDYNSHKPMTRQRVDEDNHTDKLRKTDHTYSDLFGQSGKGGNRSPVKQRPNDLNEGTKFAKRPIQEY